jgi:hypothetical protein
MKKIFEPSRQHDPELHEVMLSDEGGYKLEMTLLNKTTAAAFVRKTTGFYRSDSLESNLDFSFERNNSQDTITLSGNLPNALKFLQVHRLISQSFYIEITSDGQIKELLHQCKDYKLPTTEEDITDAIKSFQSKANPLPSLVRLPSQEAFLTDLKGLPAPMQLQVLNQLARDLEPDIKMSVQIMAPTPRS